MNQNQVRNLLWEQFNEIPNETLQALVQLIESVCHFVIATEQLDWINNDEWNESHEL